MSVAHGDPGLQRAQPRLLISSMKQRGSGGRGAEWEGMSRTGKSHAHDLTEAGD